MRIIIADTNVVASGLMTARSDAPPTRVLEGMLTGRFLFAVSNALLVEYRDVLNRPKLRKRHGLSRSEIESLLVTLAENAIVLQPGVGPQAPDPGDQHLWDLLVSHADLCLVTGDAALLHARNPPAAIISPANFIVSQSGQG